MSTVGDLEVTIDYAIFNLSQNSIFFLGHAPEVVQPLPLIDEIVILKHNDGSRTITSKSTFKIASRVL